MQILIDVTVAHGDSIGLLFNPSKTKVMIIGKLRTNFEPLPGNIWVFILLPEILSDTAPLIV